MIIIKLAIKMQNNNLLIFPILSYNTVKVHMGLFCFPNSRLYRDSEIIEISI